MSAPSHAALSDQGIKPDNNEDACFADAGLGLWFVADGMGGHASGEIASDIVRRTVVEQVGAGLSLADAITDAHDAVVAAGKDGVGSPGMGSTIVALRLADHYYQLAWVGDSRAYLWDGNGLSRLSHDHSVVQTLLDRGMIDAEEAAKHPDKNLITQALGIEKLGRPSVDQLTGQLLQGQRILLCSDGLSDELTDEQMAHILAEDLPVEQTVQHLIQAALQHGGSDNVTAVLVHAPPDAPASYRAGSHSPFETDEPTAAAPAGPGYVKPLIGILAGAIAAVLLVLLIDHMR